MSSISDHAVEARAFNPNATINLEDYFVLTKIEGDEDDQEDAQVSEEQEVDDDRDATDNAEPSDSSDSKKPVAADKASHSVEAVLEGLKAKSDTQKAAALSILKYLLERRPRMGRDAVLITRIWTAIPSKFLDRLLRAAGSAKLGPADIQMQLDLAVSIIYTFSRLLPAEQLEEDRMLGRLKGLLGALSICNVGTRHNILHILEYIERTPKGLQALVQVENLIPLVDITPIESGAVDVLNGILITGSAYEHLQRDIQLALENIVPRLIMVFEDGSDLLKLFVDIFRKFSWELYSPTALWFNPLVSYIKMKVLTKTTFEEWKSITIICAALLRHFTPEAQASLFSTTQEDIAHGASEDQPFSLHLISKTVIDLKVALPSLLAIQYNVYLTQAERLASGFKVLTSFVGFLIQDNAELIAGSDAEMKPELLLYLRRDIAEMMELLIEYFRDKWDLSVAAVAKETATVSPSEKTRTTFLHFTGRTETSSLESDPLPFEAIEALALWLREDDSKKIRRLASGITDVLLALYSNHAEEDMRLPILDAFLGILTTPHADEIFLKKGGWETLWCRDLSIFLSTTPKKPSDIVTSIEIVRVLLGVVERCSPIYIRMDGWIDVVRVVAKGFPSHLMKGMTVELAVWTSSFQLATEIIVQMTPEARMANKEYTEMIVTWVHRIAREFRDDRYHSESVESAKEVEEVLTKLGIRGALGGGA